MTSGYEIRPIEENELQQTLELVWRVFQEFEASEYSPEGVEEFRSYIAEENILRMLRGSEMQIWICSDGHRVVGMIAAVRTSHVSLLFVDPAHHRRGIARALFERLLDQCRGAGSTEITVNSSPYAAEAYHRLGFADTNGEQTVNGIRFIPMKRIL